MDHKPSAVDTSMLLQHWSTYITAKSILFTALKNSKNIPGPRSPILVINLLTDKTVHLFAIRASDRWPAAEITKTKGIFALQRRQPKSRTQ